jgi:hypothetical protein
VSWCSHHRVCAGLRAGISVCILRQQAWSRAGSCLPSPLLVGPCAGSSAARPPGTRAAAAEQLGPIAAALHKRSVQRCKRTWNVSPTSGRQVRIGLDCMRRRVTVTVVHNLCVTQRNRYSALWRPNSVAKHPRPLLPSTRPHHVAAVLHTLRCRERGLLAATSRALQATGWFWVWFLGVLICLLLQSGYEPCRARCFQSGYLYPAAGRFRARCLRCGYPSPAAGWFARRSPQLLNEDYILDGHGRREGDNALLYTVSAGTVHLRLHLLFKVRAAALSARCSLVFAEWAMRGTLRAVHGQIRMQAASSRRRFLRREGPWWTGACRGKLWP